MVDPQAEVDPKRRPTIDWVIDLTTNVRSAKNELGIPPERSWRRLPSPPANWRNRWSKPMQPIERLARLTPVTVGEAPSGPAMQVTAGSDAFIIPLEGIIDIAAEKRGSTKGARSLRQGSEILEGRLSNANFVERAKPEAVEKGTRGPCASHRRSRPARSGAGAAGLEQKHA